MDGLIGKTIGGYQILEQIGEGGMATVYKAYQPSLDRYVAVKILPRHLSQEPGFTKRFTREARAVAKLEHPHILPIYDSGLEEGLSYIVMRFIDAGTLKDLMAQPLDMQQISNLIGQIAAALDQAHEQGYVHRDVKPSNVLLDRESWVLLSDFGLAKMMEGSEHITATGVGVGTPAYMSPEQGRGDKVDHRSDVYSLGVVLYEMLTGQVPYHAETPMAVVFKHIYEPLPLPREINPDIPEALERVLLKALAKERADRYQSAGEVAEALKDSIQGLESKAMQAVTADQVPTVLEDVEADRLPVSESLRRVWWLVPVALVLIVVVVLSRINPLRMQIAGEEPVVSEAPSASECFGASVGDKVVIFQPWSGDYKADFLHFLNPIVEKCGIVVELVTLSDMDLLNSSLEAGDQVDIVILSQPLLNKQTQSAYAELLVPLADEWAEADNYMQTWRDLGSYQGKWYAVPVRVMIKSFIWYSPKVFDSFGYDVPTTFFELNTLVERMVSDGNVPWSMGFESGEADAWAGSDFIQDLLLMLRGPEYVLGLVDGSVPYNDGGVYDAYEIYVRWATDPKYTVGGADGTLSTNFFDAIFMPFSDPPETMMVSAAGWIGSEIAKERPEYQYGDDYDFFLFPGVKGLQGKADWLMVFNPSPAVKSVIRYITSEEGGQHWASVGFELSPNMHALDAYQDPLLAKMSEYLGLYPGYTPDLGDTSTVQFSRAEWEAIIEVVSGGDIWTALARPTIAQEKTIGDQ